MKAYTDLEQSKKLAEILPIESADMCFNISVRKNMPPLMIPYSRFDEFFSISPTPNFLIPCWSLAALLDILPAECECMSLEYINYGGNKKYYMSYVGGENTENYDNPIDACYEMIVWLKENGKL